MNGPPRQLSPHYRPLRAQISRRPMFFHPPYLQSERRRNYRIWDYPIRNNWTHCKINCFLRKLIPRSMARQREPCCGRDYHMLMPTVIRRDNALTLCARSHRPGTGAQIYSSRCEVFASHFRLSAAKPPVPACSPVVSEYVYPGIYSPGYRRSPAAPAQLDHPFHIAAQPWASFLESWQHSQDHRRI